MNCSESVLKGITIKTEEDNSLSEYFNEENSPESSLFTDCKDEYNPTPAKRQRVIASITDLEMSSEEYERRRIRRERNKMAAAKCRQKRVQITNDLLAETDEWESRNSVLEKEIENLEKQKNKLEKALLNHLRDCSRKNDDASLNLEIFGNGASERCDAVEAMNSNKFNKNCEFSPTNDNQYAINGLKFNSTISSSSPFSSATKSSLSSSPSRPTTQHGNTLAIISADSSLSPQSFTSFKPDIFPATATLPKINETASDSMKYISADSSKIDLQLPYQCSNMQRNFVNGFCMNVNEQYKQHINQLLDSPFNNIHSVYMSDNKASFSNNPTHTSKKYNSHHPAYQVNTEQQNDNGMNLNKPVTISGYSGICINNLPQISTSSSTTSNSKTYTDMDNIQYKNYCLSTAANIQINNKSNTANDDRDDVLPEDDLIKSDASIYNNPFITPSINRLNTDTNTKQDLPLISVNENFNPCLTSNNDIHSNFARSVPSTTSAKRSMVNRPNSLLLPNFSKTGLSCVTDLGVSPRFQKALEFIKNTEREDLCDNSNIFDIKINSYDKNTAADDDDCNDNKLISFKGTFGKNDNLNGDRNNDNIYNIISK